MLTFVSGSLIGDSTTRLVFFTSVTWEHWEIKLIFVFPHQVLRQGKDSPLTVPQLDRSSWRHACNVPCHKTSLPANCSGHAVIKISKSLNSVLNVRKIHIFWVNTQDLRLIIYLGKVGDGRTWGWLSHRGTEVKRQPLYNCTYWHRSYQTVQRGQSTVLEIKISNFFFYFHFKHPIMSSVWLQNFEMIQSSL